MSERRIFGTTKGKVLVLLCREKQTVAELASHIGVTANAIRAQIQRLQRDGLVVEAGSRRGVRRPHAEYELSAKAHELFPRAYEPALRTLVNVLADRVSTAHLRQLLLETGRRFLRHYVAEVRGKNPRKRLGEMIRRLNGGSLGIELAEDRGMTVIRSCSCPLASVTATHPEICETVAKVMAEVMGTEVREICERGASPRCCFEMTHSVRQADA
jgi:predicted ArsR family transcriptional regulator